MSFANGLAIFLAFVTAFLLMFAWALHYRDEAKIRLVFVVLALIASASAVGAWAGGRWY